MGTSKRYELTVTAFEDIDIANNEHHERTIYSNRFNPDKVADMKEMEERLARYNRIMDEPFSTIPFLGTSEQIKKRGCVFYRDDHGKEVYAPIARIVLRYATNERLNRAAESDRVEEKCRRSALCELVWHAAYYRQAIGRKIKDLQEGTEEMAERLRRYADDIERVGKQAREDSKLDELLHGPEGTYGNNSLYHVLRVEDEASQLMANLMYNLHGTVRSIHRNNQEVSDAIREARAAEKELRERGYFKFDTKPAPVVEPEVADEEEVVY